MSAPDPVAEFHRLWATSPNWGFTTAPDQATAFGNALDLVHRVAHLERTIADLVGEENSSSRVDLAVAAIGRDRLEKLGVLYDPERDGDL